MRKTIEELMANTDDAELAQDVYDGFQGTPGKTLDPDFDGPFSHVIMFPNYSSADGFQSLFDQIVIPADWPLVDALLVKIGAQAYGELLGQARRLYFGGDYLPADVDERQAFESVVWSDPDGEEGREFDRIARLAEEAFESDEVIRKLGTYLRENWNELYRER